MSRSRYINFFEDTTDVRDNILKTFPREDFIKALDRAPYYMEVIPTTLEYRPDLYARIKYGDANLYYILVFANNFKESPQDFYAGRRIKIIREDYVEGLF